MATTLAQQPQAIHRSYGQPTYQQNSTPPSNHVSPTNYTSYLHARQVNQPKQPLYVPAVYRPTELGAARQASLTPPHSASTSVDSNTGETINFSLPSSPPASLDEDSERSFAPWGQDSISRVVSDEWNNDVLGLVTGAPTRNHWKVSRNSLTCPPCIVTFFRSHLGSNVVQSAQFRCLREPCTDSRAIFDSYMREHIKVVSVVESRRITPSRCL